MLIEKNIKCQRKNVKGDSDFLCDDLTFIYCSFGTKQEQHDNNGLLNLKITIRHSLFFCTKDLFSNPLVSKEIP